jgi:hypothetical protein
MVSVKVANFNAEKRKEKQLKIRKFRYFEYIFDVKYDLKIKDRIVKIKAHKSLIFSLTNVWILSLPYSKTGLKIAKHS